MFSKLIRKSYTWAISYKIYLYTAQKRKFSIKDLFRKCNQIRRKLQIWSHFLEKPLMEKFIFYALVYAFCKTEIVKSFLKYY